MNPDTELVEEPESRGGWTLRRARIAFETRNRLGFARVRLAVLPVAEACVAAAIAYLLAQHVLGHELPFFAAVAAWSCLGFTVDRPLRRVAEVAFGVTLGVAMGDLFGLLFGSGAIQVVVALFVSALIARFIDSGAVLVAQAGTQAIVIVGMPALQAAPFARVQDTLFGAVIALIAAALLPGDPRRRARAQARAAVGELVVLFETLSRGLARGDQEIVDDALVRARGTQPALDEWAATISSAIQAARISPSERFGRGVREEVDRLRRASTTVDRAVRSTRVVIRRAGIVVEDGRTLPELASAMSALALATRGIADALGTGLDPAKARPGLLAAVRELEVATRAGDPESQTLIDISRSVVVDLLQATGLGYGEARAALGDQPAG